MKKNYPVCVVRAVLMQYFMVSMVTSSSNLTDQMSLLDFRKLITVDPGNILANNWTTRTSFCTWIGVTCSLRRERVTALSLYNMSLQGTISPSIGNLSFLVSLDLNKNNFHGNLPYELGYLQRLKVLDLQVNQLEGSIPHTLFQCRALQQLLLSQNRFTGDIPKQLGEQLPELQLLSLSYNAFTGSIPREIGNLTKLKEILLGRNNLTGNIPPSIGNISTIEIFSCVENDIQGDIPVELGNLLRLTELNFDYNNLTGVIPEMIFNISSLKYIAFTENRLSGTIPLTTGLLLPNLKGLFLAANRLSGDIPISISNASNLLELELSQNFFSGTIPNNLGNLRQLQFLNLQNNLLSNDPSKVELDFLTPLSECRSLQFLILGDNRLNGILPSSVANLSSSIEMFNIDNAQIKGKIPLGIGNLSDMITLLLGNNELSGTIPSTIGQLTKLQRLYLPNTGLQDAIPNELCNLNRLGELHIGEGNISGPIPDCIGNLSLLRAISLQSNKLTSTIPSSFWSLAGLVSVNLSHNSLANDLSAQVGNLKVIEGIDLSWNQMTGNISSTIGDLKSLRSLYLSHNSFQGPIPKSFENLISLETMDVSSNALSGTIPSYFQNLSQLTTFNVSFNRLQGEIPSRGLFATLTSQSVMGNEGLCGSSKLQVPPCATTTAHKSQVKLLVLKIVLPTIASAILVVAFLLWWIRYRMNRKEINVPFDVQPMKGHRMITYQELVQATNNFSEANLLGKGSFSSVYKGLLSDATVGAVKVLNLQHEGAVKSFDVECQVISSIRHRNLIKVISTCSNLDFRALILQYMPKGSLEDWLYSHNDCLDLLQRVSAVLDVAMALDYLHNYYSEPVVHCDLKPSNILFDEDMVAHVGDFGIAKILAENKYATQTKTLGTIGYIAPEYGSEGRVSTSSDVYSYGIVLMETFTRKRPTDDMFTEDWSLRQWLNTSNSDQLMEVIDTKLLNNEDKWTTEKQHGLLSIIGLAFECTRDLPGERINMNEVVVRLVKIKDEILLN
ncbi:hypothetical protein AQUCO_03100075v1 [Aquilegia coerulea]|uniref:non-specific serine/threonine protein kinase n=1 Tax=Aquilegia coerulea TaxID=218851 RepID=A0A2G5D0M6_AQUCA|nr:hypothetical protein AQUCO_03100075v1 [Aquilegia coerulea]